MQTCTQCGLENQTTRFCVRCGTMLAPLQAAPYPQQGHAATPPPPAPVPMPTPGAPSPGRKRSALGPIMVGLALLLVAGLGTGVWLVSRDDDGPAAADDSARSDGDSVHADIEADTVTDGTDSAEEETDTDSANDPLGLGRELLNQECSGAYLVMLASTGVPKDYVPTLEPALAAAPTAHYLVTNQSCAAFNQEVDGKPIYAAYAGPHDDLEAACDQRQALAYRGSYVRHLDTATESRSSCGCVVGHARPQVSRTIGESSVTASFAVQDVQVLLNAADEKREIVVDGVFGPITERWVRRTQRGAGLPVDGVVDEATWDVLAQHCP